MGVAICLFVELCIWGAYRVWRNMLAPPPTPPPQPHTQAQLLNQEVFDDQRAYHPKLVSLRYRRRGNRGRTRAAMERELRENDEN